MISYYRQNLLSTEMITSEKKIVIFLQYIGYYSFTNIYIYLWNINVIKNYKI